MTAETAPITLFKISSIIIPEDRQREKAEADDVLITSIRDRGLINPIILREDGTLVAGERRLDAFRKLNLPTIPARIFEQLSPTAQFEIELQENLARKQLTWQEEVRAIGRYHTLRKEAFAGWTQMGTATALGLSTGHTSTILAVAEAIDDEEVAACPTLRGAFNLLTARADRARIAAQSRGLAVAGAIADALPAIPANASPEERTAALLKGVNLGKAMAKTVDDLDKNIALIQQGKIAAAALEQQRKLEISNDIIINADFLDWAADYTGPKFDVLHVDFPYGKNYKGAGTRKTGKVHIAPVYADDPDIFFGLVAGLLAVQDSIAFPAAHCLFWYDMIYHQWTIDQFEAAGWKLVQPFPYIWTKGYQGIASDPKRRPRHCYETCLLFSRGDRKLVKLDKDHFDCLVDEKLHLNQKPLPMLKHLLSMFVDEHTAVLDPTCGSGSAIVAAKQLKSPRYLGIELDPNNADVARFLLQRHTADAPTEDDANEKA